MIKTFVRKFPLITFFALANLYVWFGGICLVKGGVPFFGEWPVLYQGIEVEKIRLWRTLLLWTPNFAAVTVLLFTAGTRGVKELFAQFLRWRTGGWWLVAFGLPIALTLLAAVVHHFVGGDIEPAMAYHLVPIFGLVLLQSVTESGFGEEAGWRGFALPRLQEKFSPLSASVVLGLLWAAWHAPMFYFLNYTSMEIVNFNIMIVCLSVVYTWIYNATGASLLMVAVIHNTMDSIFTTISTRVSNFASLLSEQALGDALNVVLLVFVVALLLATKGRLGEKRREAS